jgi:pimeloyl-ACP methyl ester carboxylesterase
MFMPEKQARRLTLSTRLEFSGVDGARLVGDAHGQPGDPAVLLLHGGGQTRHAWGDTAQRLAQAGFYALSLDLRGHGDSDWSKDGNYHIERYLSDLDVITAALGQKPALVGASFGGIMSLLAQGANPELAWALVLVDIATTAQLEGIRRIVNFMTQAPNGFASLEEVAEAIQAYQPQRKRPPSLEGLAKNVRKGEDGRYRWHWDPAFIRDKGPDNSPLRRDRLEEAARALRVPTLLVRGKQSDVIALSDVHTFQSHAPHAEFVDVRDAGHMVAGDVNDVFSDAVIDFLTRHVPRS